MSTTDTTTYTRTSDGATVTERVVMGRPATAVGPGEASDEQNTGAVEVQAAGLAEAVRCLARVSKSRPVTVTIAAAGGLFLALHEPGRDARATVRVFVPSIEGRTGGYTVRGITTMPALLNAIERCDAYGVMGLTVSINYRGAVSLEVPWGSLHLDTPKRDTTPDGMPVMVGEGYAFTVDTALLAREAPALLEVAAKASSAMRRVLTGVVVMPSPGNPGMLDLFATDSYRLHLATVLGSWHTDAPALILDAGMVKRMVSEGKRKGAAPITCVSVTRAPGTDDLYASARFGYDARTRRGGVTVTGRIIEGEAPDAYAVRDRRANDGSVVAWVTGSRLTRTPVGDTGVVAIEGEGMERTGVNPAFLDAALAHSGPAVAWTDPLQPLHFRRPDGTGWAILMPVRLPA